MIKIKEDKCIKLSGITSLFISFDFNLLIIDVIKSTDKYIYDKKTHIWEVPITSLAYLLDELTYLDDIEVQLYNDDKNKQHYYPKLEYKITPFQHQLEGVEWGLNCDAFLLLDDPGAGKTAQMIYLAEELKAQRGLEHCLIICGVNSLKANWKKEIKKFSDLSLRVLGEKINKKGKISYSSIKERAEELMRPLDAFYIITNIETIRDDTVVQALKTTKNKIGMVVVDECHKCLAGDTSIDTDLGIISIKDIVENKIHCNVKSFDGESISYDAITSYYKSEIPEELIQLDILDDNVNVHILKCTPDHPIFTENRGYVSACDLNEHDILKID